MDTSEQYIKMCKMATELQRLKYPKPVYLHRLASGTVCHWQGDLDWGEPPIGNEVLPLAVYLPRQDQLQEMIQCDGNVFWSLHLRFTEYWLARNIGTGIYDEMTLEQLWLIFVMHEKYHKSWNGSDWVPLDKNTKSC